MTFLPKTFDQIVSTMMNLYIAQTTAITDFNIGSVVRTLMESVAAEQERIYVQTFEGLSDAVDSSAFTSFGFTRLDSVAASGQVTLTRTGGYDPTITIPANTAFAVGTSARTFATTTSTTWLGPNSVNPTVTVNVVCQTPGALGNVAAGSVNRIVTTITGVASVTNAKAFINGSDLETLDQRRARFASYVASLPRSTKAALEYGAKTTTIVDAYGYVTERVAKVHAYEVNTTTPTAVGAPGSVAITPASMVGIATGTNLLVDAGAQAEIVAVASTTSTTFTAPFTKTHSATWTILGVGTGSVFIHNGVGTPGGQVTSAGLVTACQSIINGTSTVPGYKAAGVTVTAAAATEVDTTIKVIVNTLAAGYTLALVRGTVLTAITTLVASLNVADPLLVSAITQSAKNVPGVLDVSVLVNGSTANITTTDGQIIVSSNTTASQFVTPNTGLDINIT